MEGFASGRSHYWMTCGHWANRTKDNIARKINISSVKKTGEVREGKKRSQEAHARLCIDLLWKSEHSQGNQDGGSKNKRWK